MSKKAEEIFENLKNIFVYYSQSKKIKNFKTYLILTDQLYDSFDDIIRLEETDFQDTDLKTNVGLILALGIYESLDLDHNDSKFLEEVKSSIRLGFNYFVNNIKDNSFDSCFKKGSDLFKEFLKFFPKIE